MRPPQERHRVHKGSKMDSKGEIRNWGWPSKADAVFCQSSLPTPPRNSGPPEIFNNENHYRRSILYTPGKGPGWTAHTENTQPTVWPTLHPARDLRLAITTPIKKKNGCWSQSGSLWIQQPPHVSTCSDFRQAQEARIKRSKGPKRNWIKGTNYCQDW